MEELAVLAAPAPAAIVAPSAAVAVAEPYVAAAVHPEELTAQRPPGPVRSDILGQQISGRLRCRIRDACRARASFSDVPWLSPFSPEASPGPYSRCPML